MGGGLLQIEANSAIDPIFTDPNYTLFLAVYHKYTPFSIQDYTLKLSSLSDFGKKLEVTIPKAGDLLTDMVLTIDLPQVIGEYIFTNQQEYLNSLTSQFTFSIMNDVQQYNENLYKLSLGNSLQVYLVRDSQIGKYQLILPLLDATMFLTQGKTQKYDLTSFLASNSQFFDNQYNLHVIQNLNYGVSSNITNIDYLNYAFQDKEFYFFIANLLNIKQIDPSYKITYYNDWITVYYNTVKKYILRRPELVALNTFIENMNTQITNSVQINNYVFNYPSIFSVAPLDYEYNVILPIILNYDYYLTYKSYDAIINNKNYVLDWTTLFFSIFNRRYVLIKRNNSIIGAANINNIIDTNPLNLILRPFRHIYKNKLLNNNNFQLFIYYGFSNLQFEPKNFAQIASFKLNINQLHEFTLDRSIEINVGDVILIGINSTELPSNNYNELYGIFKISQVIKSFSTVDQFTDTGYNTILSAIPIEVDQILSTDTILINTNTTISSSTFYNTYNSSVASNTPAQELISLIKQNIYSDVSISTLTSIPINSVSQYLLNQIINSTDFLLTPSIIPVIQNNITTYISDSYNVLFSYIKNVYYKTVLKSTTDQDYLNNVYYTVNYQQVNNIFSFIGAGTSTFANLLNGAFRYQLYLTDIINTQLTGNGEYVTGLSYTNFLTSYIIQQYQSLSISYTNNWSSSLLEIGLNLSDIFTKILKYLQTNLRTLVTFKTTTFNFIKNDLTNLSITYNKKTVTPTNISNYNTVTYSVPLNIVSLGINSIIFDMTLFIASIHDAFNFKYIDLSSIVFTYTTNSSSGKLNVINITNFLDNYSESLIPVINNNSNFTTQLYGNNVLLDYINTQSETMFGLMKNYELSRKTISRNGGTRYSTYQEDEIDQNPLLQNNTYLINFLSEEYFPRFLYSKQTQLYQNIFQKVDELSQNYATVPSSIYFMNNINYPRTDGYNYLNNSQGSIPYLDPNQIPVILNPVEYSYTLLDKVSVNNIYLSPQIFSFMHYLEELEEHTVPDQRTYLQTYWNNIFIQSGVTTTTTNNYVAALSGKDDALLIYYIYKYLTELLTLWGDMYTLPVNLDETYFQTIYQLSPSVLGNLLFNTFLFIIQTTEFPIQDSFVLYQNYNSIIQGNQNLYTVCESYNVLPKYTINDNTQFNNDKDTILQEISYVFQVVSRLLLKYNINVVLTAGLALSNYPIVNSIHGSGKLTKIILVSDQYTIDNNNNSNFDSSIAFPTGYYVSDYYRLFNLSIHYDFQKYVFFAGYGGILRDTQYPNKTLASFYQKINNYLTASVNNVDFAFFYAYQTANYLPNMEGHLIQSYQAWIQRSAQPYFYYYNLLSQFYDMMYIYSGRSFLSEYYTINTTNNTNIYDNRHDVIQGVAIYATRMAYGTRDNIGRLNGVSMRYNLLDQRLYGIDDYFTNQTANNYNTTQDPIHIINILSTLNQRFTDYQEFLVLMKNSQNIIGSYPIDDIYSTTLTQFKVNSVSMVDLDIFNGWNNFLLNYYANYSYNFSSIITGISETIDLYNKMSSNTLDMSSLGYELYNFTNNFNTINQSNFADVNTLRYENATVYHHLIDDLNNSINYNLSFSHNFVQRNNFNNDVIYWNDNYSLISLDFLDISIGKIMGLYQSDISAFKQLFTIILGNRQKNVSTVAQSESQIELYNNYYSINDVTSLTFYDKFYKFDSNIDYNLLPLVYHDIYNIQNASHTVVFYLNYLYSFLNSTSSKPNISEFDDPTLPVSYYFPKYLSSGVDYFLANFHQLKIDNSAFYPYKSVPDSIKLYNGTIVARPKSFMYLFILLKIQYRNYYYNTIDNAYEYVNTIDYNNKPVRHVIGLNMYSEYPDISADVAAFDQIINTYAITGSVDYLQNILHPFLVNKHIDNLLFIKDLLIDLSNVSDNASINIILPNNDNYIEFLSEKTIVTNAFDNTGLIYGQYPYTLGVLSNYNTMGELQIIDSTGATVDVYLEGNIVLPSLVAQIYYFLVSECFILNQTELIGSSFQNTPMSLGNILGQITAKDWKNGLINLISEYLFLILKSKKIIYQNSIYEISFNDIYSRLKVNTNTDTINDFLDMFINSLLTISLTSQTIIDNNVSVTQVTYLGEYEQFKIPNIFSLLSIKKNINYSQYYRLMFALRQSIIGTYNNFQERVQFHNTYDYWKQNNTILISDYTTITYNNINYMVRKTEVDDVRAGLIYYSQNRTGIPTNLFTTIIDYIISNIRKSILNSSGDKYSFVNFQVVKNGYDVTLTLYNVFFTTNEELYNISIDTGTKIITASVVSGNILPFTIGYDNLPFGYQYDFTNNTLMYQQLLYQYDIVDVLENMFVIFKNIQNINESLTVLSSYSIPYVPGPGVINTSNYNFIYFPLFIESFIYYDFTSETNPALQVSAVILPSTTSLSVSTLFNVILTNWSQFYGKFFYIYDTYTPTASTYLGTGTAIFNNGLYTGSLYITFNTGGKHFLSLTNALIDDNNPFGSSGVAVNLLTPITVSSISDGSLDNNYAIKTIPRSFLITLDKWSPALGISQLYTFFSITSDGNNLTNAAGDTGVADGPFAIEAYTKPDSTDTYYRINAIVTFPIQQSVYVYVCDENDVNKLQIAQVFALIPSLARKETINVANDISELSKNGQLNNYTGLIGVSKTFILTLNNWSPDYRLNQLYIYFADNPDGFNLGNDASQINVPLIQANIDYIDGVYSITFTAKFKHLGNNYMYLTYYPISNQYPYGYYPVNFIINPNNPIITTNISGVTGILNQYISIIDQPTSFTVTLGYWYQSYIDQGVTELYIYTRNITDPDVYTSYVPINDLPDQTYQINLVNDQYELTFVANFNTISQRYVYLTYNQITSIFNYGDGLVNIQISNPPGDLVNFNYIDVINPFSTNYINNNLYTYTTNNLQLQLNNYSPNYNIYMPVPNTLYLFFATTSDPSTIYTSQSIQFEQDDILNFTIYTTSIDPIFTFVSNNSTYGNGLVNYDSGPLNNIIGPVDSILGSPYYIINNKFREYIITLTNWDPSYALIAGITSLDVFIGPDVDTKILDFGNQIINNNALNFSSSSNATPGAYNMYINSIPYLSQQITNQVVIIDIVEIISLEPAVMPLPTFTPLPFTGVLSNWNALLPSQLNLFIGQTIDPTTPVYSQINVDQYGNFSFTAQVTQVPYVNFALSDATVYSTGYLETGLFQIATVIGAINAEFVPASVVIINKSTNFSILLQNWDSTYPTNIYVFAVDGNNNLLWNFGSIQVTLVNNQYYLIFTTTITDSISIGGYNVYISDTDYNIPDYTLLQLLLNQLNIVLQIELSMTTTPTPFETYTLTTFNGTVTNWNSTLYTFQMYFDYIILSNPSIQLSDPITIDSNGLFTYTNTFTSLPGINVGISDNQILGTGYIESQTITLNTIIGPVNANLKSNPYAIFDLPTDFNIILTNWDSTYPISNLYIYIGTSLEPSNLIFTFGSQSIQFDGTNYYINFASIVTTLSNNPNDPNYPNTSIVPGEYNLYLSDQDPTNITQTPTVNQLIRNFNLGLQISISSITTTPTPFQTYVSTLFSGQLTNWIPTFYPATLNLYYTTTYDDVETINPVTINNDGTFNYTDVDNTLPGVTISLSDDSMYIQSNIYTLTSSIGPVNAVLSNPYTILELSTTYSITLTNWNDSYGISGLYIYIGSDISTVLLSFGLQSIITNTITFTTTVTSAQLGIGLYNIYISDQDPTGGVTPVVNELISQYGVQDQIVLTMTTTPTPFETYILTTFNGSLSNWSILYPTTLNLFYTTLYDSNTLSELVTIDNTGAFTYTNTNNTLPGVKLAISDSTTYGTGYIESNEFVIDAIASPINPILLSNPFSLNNATITVNIQLTIYNASYPASLYAYLGYDINTLVYSMGSHPVTTPDNINYSLTFTVTLGNITPGEYNLYISDVDPSTLPAEYLVNQFVNIFTISPQINITSITTTPTPFVTYTSTTFNGSLENWITTYPNPLNLFFTTRYDDNTVVSSVTINEDGTFSYVGTDDTLPGISISLSDVTPYGLGYIQSNVFQLNSVIGYTNSVLNISYAIQNVNTTVNITLNNWNASYGISSLYIYIGSDINTPVLSFGAQTISFINNVYSIIFTANIALSTGLYTLYLCDADPTIIPFPAFLVNDTINNQLNIINQLSITGFTTTPSPVPTYTSTTYTGTITPWLSDNFPIRLYLFIAPTIDSSTISLDNLLINLDGSFSYTTSDVISYNQVNFAFGDNSVYTNSYLQTPLVPFTTIIGDINANVTPVIFVENQSFEYIITLNNWNDTYGISTLYIFTATDTNFTNLNPITSASVVNTNNIYTVTFNTTFTDQSTYYFVVSDVDTPLSTPYILFQTIPSSINYLNLNFTPIILQTPITLSKPSDVPNLFMWFDANAVDNTYLNQPASGSSITSLSNNTGFSIYNMTTVNGSALFSSGITNSISLSNTGLIANVPADSFNTGLSVFIVYHNTGSSTTYTSLFYRNLIIDNNDFPNPIKIYNSSRDFGDNTLQNIQTITSPYDISVTNKNTIFYFNADPTLQYNEYSNGILTINSTINNYSDFGTQITIGIDGVNSPDYGFNGSISEILIYNRTLNLTEQQTLEGYLAWKWNLFTNLPESHPYSYLNGSFVVPVNTYVGISTPYQILLKDYIPASGITTFTIQYNTTYSTSPTGLTVISTVPITQDENNNYVLNFNVTFPSSNTYYMYLTDSNNNVYLSISTPIVVSNASSLITLSTTTPIINYSTTLTINLNNWTSLFGITQVGIYYSTLSDDPNPTFISNVNIQYTFNNYYVSLLVTQYPDNYYYYIIGKNNTIIINKNVINIKVIANKILTPCISSYSNYILDPKLIPGLHLWLDANTVSGTYLNQPSNNSSLWNWIDKSSNAYSGTINGTVTFVQEGINQLPSIQLSTGNNLVYSIPSGTFAYGLTAFVVYQSNGTPSTYETLISRVNVNARPFDMFNTTRLIGDGSTFNDITSDITINNNTTPSVFYMNSNSVDQTYSESNNFINVVNQDFTNWDDTNGNLYIGSREDGTTNFNGYISEVLIFNSNLTNIQKYQIEAYLAYKWNLQIYLPLYHPFSSYKTAIFTPLLFDSLQLWMDSDNSSSVIISNDNVIQWNDASYNHNDAIINNSFNSVITGTKNNNTTLVFNSSVMTFNDPTILLNAKDVTLMFIIDNTNSSSSSPFNNFTEPEFFPSTDGNIYTSFGLSTNTNIGPLPSGWIIYTVVASSKTNTTNFYINGVNIYSGAYSNAYYNNQLGWSIGSNDLPMSSVLGEMLVFNIAVSNNTRILLEGYLSNKWALNSLLPINSPYKYAPPKMTDYNNLLNEGLQMNLDASSSSNFTLSGDNIVSWNDLTTNNNSLTSTYGSPVLQINPENDLTGVYFDYNSMEPSNIANMVLNSTEFSIFTVGYVNNTDGSTNPTIMGSDNYPTYYFNIGQNISPYDDQISIRNGASLELSAKLLNTLPSGIQNMNGDSSIQYASSYVNGINITTTNEMTLGDTFVTNFFLGGYESDVNSFIEDSYIHKVLIYNRNLDDTSRYIIESQLSVAWNVPTTNGLANINSLNAYVGINTEFTILLENWSLTSVSSVYVGYNTDPNSLTNLNVIGSFVVNQLNSIYYLDCNTVFGTSNTYYIHLVDQNDIEYASINKKIIVQNLSDIINTESSLTLSEGATYNLQLNNWSTIVNTIGLYSSQITNFNLYLGTSLLDPSPLYITNLNVLFTLGEYYLQIPGLTGVNGLYLYLSTVMNGITINISPIALSMSGSISLDIDKNYGILNTANTFTLTINTNIPDLYTILPSIRVYYALTPNETNPTYISTNDVNSSNKVIFSYTTAEPTLYFYVSSYANYMGLKAYIGPINFIDITTLSITLDTYDLNTNTRNVLLNGWSPILNQITNLNVLSGTQSDYSGQTLVNNYTITKFKPTDISGINLWLDASSSSNFILSTNTITQWIDNSGISNNAVNPDDYNPSYDSVNLGVSFTGGKYLYLPDGTIPTNDNNYHIFIVLTTSDSSSGPQFILGSIDDISTPGTNMSNTFWTVTNSYDQSWNNNNDLISNSYIPNNKQIVSFEYISEVNRTTYINGVVEANDLPVPRNSTSYNNLIGGLLQNQTFTNLIHEIIIYTNQLSTIQRQQVENYLSYKWSINL